MRRILCYFGFHDWNFVDFKRDNGFLEYAKYECLSCKKKSNVDLITRKILTPNREDV